MNSPRSTLAIGIGSILFGLFLVLVGIPYGVSSPANVSRIVLSPVFWPEILAGGFILVGLLMSAGALRVWNAPPPAADSERVVEAGQGGPKGLLRLALMAGVMAGYFLLIPVLGMVWASIPAFIATALLVQTRHPAIAIVTAVLLPLILYGFFVHVAGVGIPQGQVVSLP